MSKYWKEWRNHFIIAMFQKPEYIAVALAILVNRETKLEISFSEKLF